MENATITTLTAQFPLIEDLIALKETTWLNPRTTTLTEGLPYVGLTKADVDDAHARLKRFAPYLAKAFPETAATGGIIESDLVAIPAMQARLEKESGKAIPGTLLLKKDSHLPISGSIKARGDRSLEGRYDLWVSPAPRTVTLMGAVATPGKLAWRPGASIRDYLQGQLRLAGADRNNVTVIDPDGSTVVAPVAYWNARHIEAEPGAVLWVGFDPRAVPDDFTGLNEQIVALLTRRIPD